jgi:hypothetical protein
VALRKGAVSQGLSTNHLLQRIEVRREGGDTLAAGVREIEFVMSSFASRRSASELPDHTVLIQGGRRGAAALVRHELLFVARRLDRTIPLAPARP